MWWLALGCVHKLPPFPTPAVDHAGAIELPMVHVPGDLHRPYVVIDSPALGKTLWFLDTGYSHTTCDTQWVESMGLSHRASLSVVKGRGGLVPQRHTRLPELVVQDTHIGAIACAVRDVQATSSIKDERLAGVLGTNVLRAWTVELDFQAGVLRLHDPDQVALDASDARMRTRRSAHRARVQVHAGDRSSWPIVDSGARLSYVDAERLELPVAREVDVLVRSTGAPDGEVRTLRLHDAQGLAVAGSPTQLDEVFDEDRGPGLLGMDVLIDQHVWLDYRRKRVRWEPAPDPEPLPVY